MEITLNKTDDKKFYSPRALCARWGVSESTLYRRRRDGMKPDFVRIGGMVAYPISEIEAFEAELENER